MEGTMIYFVHLKGCKPFATSEKDHAVSMMNYLKHHGFNVSMTAATSEKATYLILNKYC